MVERLNYNNDQAYERMIVGKSYWITMVTLNNKRTGLKRNVKPFQSVLKEKHDRKYGKYYEWDLSGNPKYAATRNANSDVFYDSLICDEYTEAIEEYIRLIITAANSVSATLKGKEMNTRAVDAKYESIIKNIPKERRPVIFVKNKIQKMIEDGIITKDDIDEYIELQKTA